MDPFTIMLLTSAAVSAGGALIKGFSGQAAAARQAERAQRNADLLGKQAEIEAMGADVAAARGSYQQFRQQEVVRRVIAAQPGVMAASGLSSTAPTPQILLAYSAMQGEADRQIIVANTELEIATARTRAANTLAQAAGQESTARALDEQGFSSMIAGIIGAGTAFLQAGTGLAKTGALSPARDTRSLDQIIYGIS